jgi:acyl carrier protein
VTQCFVGVCSSPVHCKEIGHCFSSGAMCHRHPAPYAAVPLVPTSPTVEIQLGAMPPPSAEWLALQEIAKACGYDECSVLAGVPMMERVKLDGRAGPASMVDFIQFLVKTLQAIDSLRNEEGTCLGLFCDGSEPYHPNNAIEVTAEWTDWQPRRFNGDSLLHCLSAALALREVARAQATTGDPSAMVALRSIEERVKNIIASFASVPVAKVIGERELRDGVCENSLETVELIMAIEDEFDIEIPDDEMAKFVTVQNLVDYVKTAGGL